MDSISLGVITAALAGLTFHSSGWFVVAVCLIVFKFLLGALIDP
jgi:hypothetical protein